MPKMHAISLLSSGALIGTIVGYAIAKYGPRLSAAGGDQGGPSAPGPTSPQPNAPAPVSAWIKGVRSWFAGTEKSVTSAASSSGNRAFDEYREATLKRLEEDQNDFEAYLGQLRRARDKETFDAYLANRTQAYRKQE